MGNIFYNSHRSTPKNRHLKSIILQNNSSETNEFQAQNEGINLHYMYLKSSCNIYLPSVWSIRYTLFIVCKDSVLNITYKKDTI